MGIHYDYKSKRGERAMLKEAKRKARLAQRRAKRLLSSGPLEKEEEVNEEKEIAQETEEKGATEHRTCGHAREHVGHGDKQQARAGIGLEAESEQGREYHQPSEKSHERVAGHYQSSVARNIAVLTV